MTTSVPSPTLGTTGLVVPAESDILAGIQADINAAFGGGLNQALSTPQGQLASTLAAIIADKNTQFLNIVSQVDPLYAQGRMQDAIGFLYFLDRDPAVSTLCRNCTCTGLAGTVIPQFAQAIDTADHIYLAVDGGTIPISGTIDLDFQAAVAGPVPCPAGTLVNIYVTIPGWDTITNPTDGEPGRLVETQQAFEFRRQNSVAINAQGSLPSIYGAAFASHPVDNVNNRPVDVYVTENDSSLNKVIGGVTLIPNSVYVCAYGGDSTAIASAIWSKKSPGCDYASGIIFTGTTATSVLSVSAMTSGYIAAGQTLKGVSVPTSASFTGAVATVEYSNLIVTYKSSGTLTNGMTIKGSGVPVGTTLGDQVSGGTGQLGTYELSADIGLISSESMTAQLTHTMTAEVLTINHIDVTNTGGGFLAVGDCIAGTGIPADTLITSQSTGPAGGIGRYSMNKTLTPSGSGTYHLLSAAGLINLVAKTVLVNTPVLTASAVTGGISAGQVVTGAAVPALTQIIEQLTGTPGAAGTYSLTGSMANITAEAMTSAGTDVPLDVVITSQLTGTPGGVGTYQLDKTVGTSSSATLTSGLTVKVPDTSYQIPYPTYNVVYRVPQAIPMKFDVVIANVAALPAGISTTIKNAILAAFAGEDGGVAARIGSTINASRYYAPVSSTSTVVQIISILVGITSPTLNTVTMQIDQMPTLAAADISVSMV